MLSVSRVRPNLHRVSNSATGSEQNPFGGGTEVCILGALRWRLS